MGTTLKAASIKEGIGANLIRRLKALMVMCPE